MNAPTHWLSLPVGKRWREGLLTENPLPNPLSQERGLGCLTNQ
ncbi:hypothetical protein [Alysiella filiformis]|nr:hypothetical protein [Alysiella filiformis]